MSSNPISFKASKKFQESSLSQGLPFRYSLMQYISMNPASHGKLIRCCKLFFIKCPLIPVVIWYHNKAYGMEWEYCVKESCHKCNMHNNKKFDIDKCHNNIWLYGDLDMYGSRNLYDFPSNFIHKISRYSVKSLILQDIFLSFDELKFLSRGVKEFWLCWSFVKYGNDEPVPLENIVELFQNSNIVFINFSDHPRNAVCKSYENFIDACKTIEKVELLYLPNDFDVYKFYQHLKHTKNRTSFIINQEDTSENPRLQEVIDEILQTKTFNFVPPLIVCYAQNYEATLKRIREIHDTEMSKYR